MKYRVKGIDLLIDGKKYKEGDVVEVSPKQAKTLEKYLELVKLEGQDKEPTKNAKEETTKQKGGKK